MKQMKLQLHRMLVTKHNFGRENVYSLQKGNSEKQKKKENAKTRKEKQYSTPEGLEKKQEMVR